MKGLTIDGNGLSVDDVWDVAFGGKEVRLSSDEAFLRALEDSRAFLMERVRSGDPVYGVTTGFGDSCSNQISAQKAAALQRDVVAYHGIGLGQKFDKQTARAVVLCRLNSNVKGGFSSVRLELAEMLVTLLNKDIVPVIPQLGSVGASGDLTPLSYLAAVVMGQREVYYKGKTVQASAAFRAENITALPLAEKEGLALMNGTSVMTAVASLAQKKAERLSFISDFLTAVTCEITRAKDTPFAEKPNSLKNHAGQNSSARRIRGFLSGSKRVFLYEDFLKTQLTDIKDKGYLRQQNKIQDRYSIRCAPQVNGVLSDTLSVTRAWITEEINSVNDNPLIDAEAKRVYNTGNFYGGHICAACDYLKIALANIADLSDKQAEIIIDGKFNGLTENLIPFTADDDPSSGLRLGFKAVQITISALRAEAATFCVPASLTSQPTEALNQDKVSMGTTAARKLAEQEEIIFLQFAAHILAAMQACDLCGIGDFSSFTRQVHSAVREISPFLQDDRPLDKDTEAVAQWLKTTPLFSLPL